MAWACRRRPGRVGRGVASRGQGEVVWSLLSVPPMWSHRCSLGEAAGPGGGGETGSCSVRWR